MSVGVGIALTLLIIALGILGYWVVASRERAYERHMARRTDATPNDTLRATESAWDRTQESSTIRLAAWREQRKQRNP